MKRELSLQAMRPLRALSIYILVVFIGGALIAPGLYWMVQPLEHWFPHIAGSPFHRYVNRSLLGIALIGLWPLFRSFGATSWKDIGILPPGTHWKRLGVGFALGFFSLAIVALSALAFGARTLTSNNVHTAQKLFSATMTAIAVALLEEILFRGGIFGALRRNFRWGPALVMSSSIYALVHFLGNPRQEGQVMWYSGLELLPRMAEGFLHWKQLVPGFLNLTLAGGLLALAFYRTGNLYFSIGLHAGWIFWLKSYGAFTREIAGANTWLWGSSKLIDGWLALLVLTFSLPLVLLISAPTRPREVPSSSNVVA